MKFEWDGAKDRANQRKHGVSFDQAKELFSSKDYLEIFDEAHSDTEDRFIAVGLTERGLIVVVWTSPDDETVRIISARLATPKEEALYQAYMGKKNEKN